MGAHTVFRREVDESYQFFVNTCGSAMLASIAESCGVTLKVVFEREKIQLLDAEESQLKEVSFDEEENIAADVLAALSLSPGLAERTRVINVGYDLVPWLNNMQAVTDDI